MVIFSVSLELLVDITHTGERRILPNVVGHLYTKNL